MVKQRLNRGTYRHSQSVAWERSGVDALALGHGWNRKHLRGSEHLPKSLIFPEIIGPSVAVVDPRNYNRPAISKTELIADERRNPAMTDGIWMIEVIARIECRVAYEF